MSKIAVLFPGQGSQSVGMISDVVAEFAEAKRALEEADEVLGYSLSELILKGPAELLGSTENTQPALLAVEVALWRSLAGRIDAQAMVGHSLGEYSALVCSQAISFSDGLKLVRRRGELMKEAVPNGIGGMAAILGLEDEKVEAACVIAAQDQIVQAANYNAPGQIVIAGHVEAVERAVEECKLAGARRAMILPVSGPFHSELMQPAADQFELYLNEFDIVAPQCPVLQNASNKFEIDPSVIRKNLVAQISSPVRWVQAVQCLADEGIESLIELGPGKVLAGLNKRINKSLNTTVINSVASIQ